MIKTLLKLAIFLLIVHALYRFLPVYMHYQQFKDDVEQTALFSGAASEADLMERILAHARDRQIPLTSDAVHVSTANNQTAIKASWTQPIRILPWHTYVHTFDVATSAWQVKAR